MRQGGDRDPGTSEGDIDQAQYDRPHITHNLLTQHHRRMTTMDLKKLLDPVKTTILARRDPVQRRERQLRKAHQAAAMTRERGRAEGRGTAGSTGGV